MSEKNYKLSVDVEAKSTLEQEIAKLEKLIELKKQLEGSVDIISDSDTKKITEALKEEQKLTNEIKRQADIIDEKTKALEKLVKAQSEEARELAGIKVLIQEQNKENKEAAKEALGLTSEFDKLNKKLSEYKKELATLEPGSKKFNETAKAAGQLKDQVDDAKAAVKAFATSSKAQTAKTLFSQIGNDLADLDFAGAAEKARTFSTVMKGISFSDVIGGIKNFGSAILDIGKAIASNPFTILLASIVALGVAIKGMFDSMDAGLESLRKLDEELIKVEESTRALEKANRDLGIEIAISSGKITKAQGERLLAENEFKEKYKKLLQEQRKATEDFNKSIQKEREEDGFRGTKALYEALGGQTELTKRQKIGLKEIEEKYNNERIQLQANHILNLKKIRVDADNEEEEKEKEKNEKLKKLREKAQEEQKREWEEVLREAEKQSDELVRIKLLEDKKLAEARKKQEELDKLAAKQSTDFAKKVSKDMLEELIEANEKAEKERQEQLKTADQIANAIDKGLDERSQKNLDRIAKEQEAAEKSLALQEQRAAEGLNNTLEFEQLKNAKLEEEREKQAKKDKLREKTLAFYSLVSGYAKDPSTTPSQAVLKAAKDMAISEGIALAFAEKGGVGEDLKDTTILQNGELSKTHRSGDIFTVISPKEGILNEKAMAALGGKEGFYNLTKMLENPIQDDIMFPEVPTFRKVKQQDSGLLKEIKEVKEILKNRPVSNTNVDNVGNVITENIEYGFKRITKKISQKPRFRR